MNHPENCPLCDASFIGQPIPEDIRQHYGGATHFYRYHGIEIPEVYDGSLFYRCPDCHRAFHRWPEGHELRQRAEAFMMGDAAPPGSSVLEDTR